MSGHQRVLILAAGLSLLVTGCGGKTSSPPALRPAPRPAPRPQSTAAAIGTLMVRDVKALKARSFTPLMHVVSRFPDGTLLVAFHSICTGSADGHCQAVQIFRGSAPSPIWERQYVGVTALRAAPGGFQVSAVTYAPGDPLCCPSLPSVIDTYTWAGGHFREIGPLPRAPK